MAKRLPHKEKKRPNRQSSQTTIIVNGRGNYVFGEYNRSYRGESRVTKHSEESPIVEFGKKMLKSIATTAFALLLKYYEYLVFIFSTEYFR